MGADDLKNFQMRSESVLCKMLLVTAKTIIQDVVRIKRSNVFRLLSDEVIDISNTFQLVLFVKYYEYNKENSGNYWDAIVSCITENLQELQIKYQT